MNDRTFRIPDRRDAAELIVTDTGHSIELQFPRANMELTPEDALELAEGLLAHALAGGAERKAAA